MLIRADPGEARSERGAVQAALRRGLDRPSVATVTGGEADLPLDHPGTFDFHFARTARESAARVAARSRAGAERRNSLGCPAWQVDPAPPEPHLTRSVTRALDQLPADRERPDLAVVPWSAREHAVLCAAGCLLGRVDPDALAELSVVVRQVALLAGSGIAGYTDFGVHGAIFVNRVRLTDSAAGVPARVRFAEALVHEGAHVRCNAAGWSRSCLADPKSRSVVVDTPLRPDPRPLNGLFQQFVVLIRSVELYDRVLTGAELAGVERRPVRDRRTLLHGQALEAVAALRRHRTSLSGRGMAEVELAETVLRESVPPANALDPAEPS